MMETQSPEISSTSPDSPESPPPVDPPRSPSPSMFNPDLIPRPPSPWIAEMERNREGNRGDFIFHEEQNVLPHFEFFPPEQLIVPYPIFRSTYSSGSCPYWTSNQTNTTVHLTPRCEECSSVSVIIIQDNTREIQLSLNQLYALFDAVVGNIENRR